MDRAAICCKPINTIAGNLCTVLWELVVQVGCSTSCVCLLKSCSEQTLRARVTLGAMSIENKSLQQGKFCLKLQDHVTHQIKMCPSTITLHPHKNYFCFIKIPSTNQDNVDNKKSSKSAQGQYRKRALDVCKRWLQIEMDSRLLEERLRAAEN